ncbi:cationic amino acid transporter 4-like [Equus asinus]|uniref:cationic amino acid transporter 4-like n=1 Tax=Equus asinus TaxID=9793 RepID=UPI0038F6421A
MAGPAVLMSFCVAAVASLLAALCYAELAVRVPHRGSAYLFTYLSMGELWAFLIGWNIFVECLIVGAAVARDCSSYVDAIFSHQISSFTETHVGIWQVPLLAQYPDFLVAGIALLASAFITCRAHISSWLNHIFSAINLAIFLFIIIILGFVLARPHNWSTEEGGFAPFGFSGIMAGAATCFYAFTGFDVIAASSVEAQNPKRAVPMAIAISHGLVTSAYILISTVLTLMVAWCMHMHSRMQVPVVGILVFGFLMAFLALLVEFEALVQFRCICALLTYTFVATSIIMLRFRKSLPSSSQDPGSPVDTEQASASEPGQLRPALRPYLGFLGGCRPGAAVAWALGVLVALAITLDGVLVFRDSALHLPPWGYTLLLLLSSTTFLLSLLVLGAHQQQRRQDIFQHSPAFVPQVPMVPLTPALSILLNIFLMLHLSYLAWLHLSIWLLMELMVYFGYGIWHSKENQQE